MTIYTRGYYEAPTEQAEMEAAPGRRRAAVWEATTGPIRWMRDIVELDVARKHYDEAYRLYNRQGAQEWLRGRGLEDQFDLDDRNYNELELNLLAGRKEAEQRRASVLTRSRGGLGQGAETIGISLAASFMDPLNIAAGFIPVVGQARYARLLANAGGALGRAGVRTGVGAAEGLAGMTLLEPLNFYARQQEQADYHLADSLANIGIGGLFGATLHAGGGALADAFNRRAGRDLYLPEVRATETGVDVRSRAVPAIEQAKPAPGPVGASNQVRIGDRYVPVRWAVMDAEDLRPTMEKAENQYRDRNREAANSQVRHIAANLDFNQLGHSPLMDYGAPTLSPDGRVIGGNGRLAAIRLAYASGRGDGYRSPLIDQAASFGMSPTDLKGIERPVLVRILNEDVDVKTAAIASNEGGGLRMSALEQAKVDAERLGDARAFEVNDDGSLSLGKSHNAIRRWIGEHPAAQRGALMDAQGQMSAEGVQRLRNAILFRAYGDSPTLTRLIEAVDPGSRNIAAALMRVATRVGELKASVKAGDRFPLDLSEDMQAAVEKLNRVRESGQSVAEALRQGGLFGDDLSPEARVIVGFMGEHIRSSRAIADFLSRYLDAADKAGSPKQGGLFGADEGPKRLALLERAAAEYTPSAQEQLELAPPANRLAATKAAIVQSVQDQQLDVEAVLAGDVPGAMAAAERADSPETQRLNDPKASELADDELADAPVSEEAELAAAEKALAEQQLELADVAAELQAAGVIEGGGPTTVHSDALGDIQPGENLTAAQREIEARFAEQVTADPEKAIADYAKIEATEGGKVLNTDDARELSPDYRADRSQSAAVHEPASALVKAMYARKLKEKPAAGQKARVVFSAGGTGAGKTTGLKKLGKIVTEAQVVYDTNMNTLGSAVRKIEQAIAAGKDIVIAYTYRDPLEALKNGMLGRAARQEKKLGSGRAVPIDEHLKTHVGSSQVIRQLFARYGENEKVKFAFIDNSAGKGKSQIVDIADVPEIRQEAYDGLREQAVRIVEQERAEGRISEATSRAVLAEAPANDRRGTGNRAGNLGQPESQRGARGTGDDTAPELNEAAQAALPTDLQDEAQAALQFSKDANANADLARLAAVCARRSA